MEKFYHKVKSKGKGKGKPRESDETDEDEDMPVDEDMNDYLSAEPKPSQEPLATGSSAISDHLRSQVRKRDNYGCVICGYPEVQVAHIIGKTEQVDYQVYWLRYSNISSGFMKNTAANLMSLCGPHHVAFDNHHWTLVPSRKDLEMLIDFERRDYEARERLLERGEFRSRAVPRVQELSGRCEYIFLHSSRAGSDRLGTQWEDWTDPQDEGVFPMEVTYSRFSHLKKTGERPLPMTCQVDTKSGSITFDFEETVRKKGGVQYDMLRVNPWALICRAALTLNGPYHAPKVFYYDAEHNVKWQIPSRLSETEKLVLELRNLYSRHLEHLDRKSSDTIRPGNFTSMASLGPPAMPASAESSTHSHGGNMYPVHTGMDTGYQVGTTVYGYGPSGARHLAGPGHPGPSSGPQTATAFHGNPYPQVGYAHQDGSPQGGNTYHNAPAYPPGGPPYHSEPPYQGGPGSSGTAPGPSSTGYSGYGSRHQGSSRSSHKRQG